MRWIDRSEHRPRLPVRAVVMSRIVPLRPPICLVDDAVLDRGHASGVDVAGRPKSGTLGNRPGDRGPWRPEGAVVVSRISTLRPPIGFVRDAVFRHGHSSRVDAAHRPWVRIAAGHDGRLRRHRRLGRYRRLRRLRLRYGRTAEHGCPLADRGCVLCDDVGQMQVVQRGMLQRMGLLIGRNRDDDRPVDLADRELVGLKPAEIECIAGSVEIDVGIASPIPIDLGCRHGAPP